MRSSSENVASLIATVAIISSLYTIGLAEDSWGFDLCLTSWSRKIDLSNQNLTEVPADLPSTTEYLDISHNSIQSLDESLFRHLPRLCFLKATHCGLREIPPTLFDHTPALKVLNISYNNLRTIPEISLKKLKILDLFNNLYKTYRLPASFQNLSKLEIFSLGSTAAVSVDSDDFGPLKNARLRHLSLGGGIAWKRYESGALASLSLQKLSLFASFCGNFGSLETLLEDLNMTGATMLRFVTPFPDNCNVTGDPFHRLRTMPHVRNITIENTWLNTSVLETLWKNVWLSSIQDFSFVNITYNEDKPDGFQFRTVNSTSGVRSITFDRIIHYQYKYPTFNITAEAISNLTYLRFSKTGINILPCDLISALPSLETLDLSDNLLTESGFWWYTCSYSSVFPKLRQLYVSKNRFRRLSFIADKTHQMKTLKSLDLSSNSIVLDGKCSWPSQLTELSLANNNLGNDVFQYLSPDFERVDLTKTGLSAITQEDLSRLPKLTHLQLSSNSIKVIPTHLSAPALLSLSVDQNTIMSISKEALDGLPMIHSLRAGNNPFVCSCDSYWFLTSLNKSLLFDWPLDYTCSTPPSLLGLQLSEYKPSELECKVWLQVAVFLPVCVVISMAIGLLFYKYDGAWYLKMLWVWIRMKRRGKKQSSIFKDVSFCYHAFISYSHQDAPWVDNQLVPSLEGAGFSLCVHERDFVPGDWIIDNIINCVEASYKTLFVLSNHFIQSEWCNYELFFAQHREISVQQDSMVFILLEPIPADSLPKKFLRLRRLMRQQTYLEWPKEERKQQVFWASLKSMLHMADKSIALKDAAVAIADTANLIVEQE